MSGVRLLEPTGIDELGAHFGGVVDAALRGRVIERIVPPGAQSAPSDLVLLASARQLGAFRGEGSPMLCSPELSQRLPAGLRWTHAHPFWIVAELLAPLAARFDFEPVATGGAGQRSRDSAVTIAPGAIVHPSAELGEGSRIGPNAVIYGNVALGRRVTIGASAVIGRPGFGFTVSPRGERVRIPQLGGVVIEDDVEVGPLCTVDAGTLGPTRLATGVKLDAHVHVGHNAQIGAHTVVAAQAGFAGSVVIDDGVLVGGQAGVTDHAHVGRGARVAAKSGVVGDIPAGATVAGFPAVPRMLWLRAMAALLQRRKR